MDNKKLEDILQGVKYDNFESTVNYFLLLDRAKIDKKYYHDIASLLSSICIVQKFQEDKENQIDNLLDFLRS